MPLALHLTIRTAASRGRLAAQDLQRCNAPTGASDSHWEHRVVELVGRSGKRELADLACQEHSLPEVLTAIQEADEVHLYGTDPTFMLSCFPYLKPDALAKIPLFVHGPCANLIPDPRDTSIARLEAWPGPVSYDLAASLTLEQACPPEQLAKGLIPLDPWDHQLIPRRGEAGPIEGLAPDNAVIVCLSLWLPVGVRDALKERVETLFNACPAPVDVAWIDEKEQLPDQARAHRRLAQLCIAKNWSDPICLEAMLSQTPLWVLEQSDCVLGPWLKELGVDAQLHRLPQPDAPDFDKHWSQAIELWSQGGALPAPSALRERVASYCLAS